MMAWPPPGLSVRLMAWTRPSAASSSASLRRVSTPRPPGLAAGTASRVTTNSPCSSAVRSSALGEGERAPQGSDRRRLTLASLVASPFVKAPDGALLAPPRATHKLSQADGPALVVDVHQLRRRHARKTGHGDYATTEHDDETGAGGEPHLVDGDGEVLGDAAQLRHVGEGGRGLGDADREVVRGPASRSG